MQMIVPEIANMLAMISNYNIQTMKHQLKTVLRGHPLKGQAFPG